MSKESKVYQLTDREFRTIIKTSSSQREALHRMGYCNSGGSGWKQLTKRCEELKLDTSHFEQVDKSSNQDDDIFCENSTMNYSILVSRYKKRAFKPYVCAKCGMSPYWNGKEMPFLLDHINRVPNDNRLNNLRWLCPNCEIVENMLRDEADVKKNAASSAE